ncbi:MAG: 2Fe-2S iron-sulfur cluster binding domain-containing protein [Lentisphaeria bacterium]|nr:2Fe-2S iron-sulfur cluster binding domain-containing protein [Lentisphaeria bacterium]
MTFFIAVGTLCLICVVLSALLVVADRFLNDYGTCTISINGGEKELEVRGGASLLSTLVSKRIFIPSACGGGGSCGMCKLKVLRGGGPVLATEEPLLSDEEKASNVRLSCQIKIRENIDIQIPEEYFRVREFQGEIEAITPLTHDIRLVRIKLSEPESIDFTPGAYVQLCAPSYKDSPDPVYRAYSIASDPTDTDHLDLLIRRVPKGICTTWVFEHLKEGNEVLFNGSHGDFRLSGTDAPMIFIAGGSGMAPFRSMLLDMRNRGVTRPCRYFFGAVKPRDMFYLEEMKELEVALPDFRFIPALGAPEPGDGWDGETGLVTDVVTRHFPDCSGMEAYLCGSPGMINACIKTLTGNGMPEENIFYDKFA